MDFFTRKFAFIWLKAVEVFANTVVWAYAVLYGEKRSSDKQILSVGAFWNLPPDLTGSNLRMGAWKPYLENDGVKYDNFHINKFSEYVENVERGNRTKRYLFYSKCILRRLPQILKAHKYDCLWIDRGIIPFYPRKSAFIEKQLRKVVLKIVIDTTDGGDYQANPQLMEDTFQQADEITVGYKHLKEVYQERFKVTQIFWTIPTDNYIIKSRYNLDNQPVLGWMGSPGNFQYVRDIIPQLKELAKSYDFVFRYICRENFDAEMNGIQTEHHFYGDDYYKLISSFDIGISPFLKDDLRSKGKIAMKHQEFLLMGVPQICSPVAISEFVEHEKHVFIVNDKQDWQSALDSLLANEKLRQKIGEASKNLFQEYYTYSSQYPNLKSVLTTKSHR
jgi:glycosyltransferase involved in cell wall biosynthesis